MRPSEPFGKAEELRSNKRRNLNSGQWAFIAAEAEDLVQAIAAQVEADRRAKQAESLTQTHAGVSGKYFPETPAKPDEESNRTSAKLAETFPTNRTYISAAAKIAEKAPDIAAKVKAGTMTMQDGRRVWRATEPRTEPIQADCSLEA